MAKAGVGHDQITATMARHISDHHGYTTRPRWEIAVAMRQRTRRSRPCVEAPRRWSTRKRVTHAGVSRTRAGSSRRPAVRIARCTASTARSDEQRAGNDSRDQEHNPDKAVAPLTRTSILDHPGLGPKIRCRRQRERSRDNHPNVLA